VSDPFWQSAYRYVGLRVGLPAPLEESSVFGRTVREIAQIDELAARLRALQGPPAGSGNAAGGESGSEVASGGTPADPSALARTAPAASAESEEISEENEPQ
jgi:hypothetical protein